MDTSWIITQITSRDKNLIVFYDKLQYGLFNKFSSDSEVYEFINSNPEKAFEEAVFKKKEAPYFLNIASTENFGAFEWENMRSLLKRQMTTYMPIIQKFIIDARSKNLYVPLDEEINPQKWMAFTVY